MKRLFFAFVLMFVAPAWADEVAPGVMRTPDAHFENLADYPFTPNYMVIDGVRIHYLDEGPRDGDPVFLLHGEPTWSFLFRTMIPVLVDAGHRVIVPDMVGFGKSDKYTEKDDYTHQGHVDMMGQLVTTLDLKDATFFGQDWGGMVGLRVVADHPDRFSRIVVSNTGLPSLPAPLSWLAHQAIKLAIWWQGPTTFEEMQANPGFTKWMAHSYYSEDMSIDNIMKYVGRITDEAALAGYSAPYPDGHYKAGVHVFPSLIPSQLSVNQAAWDDVFSEWDKPVLLAFTDEDPVTAGSPLEGHFLERMPKAQITQVTIKGVGHFVQEEVGPQLAELMNDFIAERPVEGFEKPEHQQTGPSSFTR